MKYKYLVYLAGITGGTKYVLEKSARRTLTEMISGKVANSKFSCITFTDNKVRNFEGSHSLCYFYKRDTRTE